MSNKEVWQNVTAGRVVVTHNTPDGERDEVIQGGREFTIDARDRGMYQNRVASDVYDPFKNGTFAPIKLSKAAEDEFDGNPNHLSEADMRTVLEGARVEAVDVLKQLTAPAVVARLVTMGRSEGVDQERVGMLEEHLRELDPQMQYKFAGLSTVDAP